ncbi:MAG: YbaK/EbsC family protein [Gemmiger sp.]
MAIEQVKDYLAAFGLADRVIEFTQSSATVAEAAADLGCEPARIAKTMAFLTGEGPVLVVMAGDGKVDNARYKARFHTKASMIKPEELVALVGHPMGGVCPFDVRPGVPVYLDESLKRFEIVYPAAGNAASAVRLTIPELERACSHFGGWVDVAKGWQEVQA